MTKQRLSSTYYNLLVEMSNSLYFFGGNILDKGPDEPPNIRTYITVFVAAVQALMSVTSIQRFSDNLQDMALPILCTGFSIQAMAKLYLLFGKKLTILKIVDLSCSFIDQCEGNPKANRCFQRYIYWCNWCRPYIFRFYLCCVEGFFLLSLAIALYTQTKFIPLKAVLPILDYKSDVGFGTNSVIYIILGIYGSFGFFASDYAYIISMVMACGQMKAIAFTCEDLTTFLEVNGSDKVQDIDHLIGEIVRLQQSHAEYMDTLDDAFGLHSYVIITSSMMSIAIALFVVIQERWIFGIIVIWLFVWQIFTLCFIGGIYVLILEKAGIKVNETKWYLLPERRQRMFVTIFQWIQNVPEPSALSRIPLNFDTFVNCVKAMYNFLMVLLNATD